jgi:hypothetical protein
VFPAAATATRYTGKAFDTCSAPSKATMKAWRPSFGGVGVYISGINRACKQPNLTRSWVRDVSAMGWRLLPISMGLQAPCRDNTRKKPMSTANSAAEGTADAKAAVTAAKALGLAAGSPVYADVESYDPRNATCAKTVAKYVSAFTVELHRSGYLAGVYGNLGSGVGDLSDRYASTAYARPDAVWLARWDATTRLTGWTGIPNAQWAVHQRSKQYRGDHYETHGGVRLNIDSDYVDGPVATVARAATVTPAANLRARQAPSTTSPVVTIHPAGTELSVLCRALGEKVEGSREWDKLSDGTYVADAYVNAIGVPHCRYPVQVVPTAGAVPRTGPGAAYTPTTTALPAGALAWVTCQAAEPANPLATVWNRLDDGRFLDGTVLARTTAGFDPAIPRC